MPELVQWLLLAGIGLATAASIGWPLIRPRTGTVASAGSADAESEAEARALRHRVALDALLDVEADRRAGSLDDASYERERSEAEARAAQTLIEPVQGQSLPSPAPGASLQGRRVALWLAAAIATALLVGFVLPAPAGLAERTVVNQALADEMAREAARQAEIQRLLGVLASGPQNPQVLSDLADAYLAGTSAEDLQRAAVALQVLLAVEPQDRSAYRRLVTAYISAADWTDARAATDSYATIADPGEPDIPFFRGLIAFRQGDNATAMSEFERFLELAPHDERAPMVTSLRAEAAGKLPGPSASPVG
jgi:cytochrome c-type biogenesis protein CcmH/NrfG